MEVPLFKTTTDEWTVRQKNIWTEIYKEKCINRISVRDYSVLIEITQEEPILETGES